MRTLSSQIIKNKRLYQRLLSESAIYGLTGALESFSALFTSIVYVRHLSIDQFGLYDYYITLLGIFYILLEGQIVSGFMRGYYEAQDSKRMDCYFGSAVSYYIICDAFFVILISMLYVTNVSSIHMLGNVLFPILLMILPKQVFELVLAELRMEKKATAYFLASSGFAVVVLSLGIISLCFVSRTAHSLVWCLCLVNCAFGLLSVMYIIRNKVFKFSFEYIAEFVKYGLPIVPSMLGAWGVSSIGKIIIKSHLSLSDLGIYSLALKIALIVLVINKIFKLTWQPYVIRFFNGCELKAKNAIVKVMNFYLLIGLLIVFLIRLSAPAIIKLIAGNKYESSINLVIYFLLAYYLNGATSLASTGNAWTRKTYYTSFGIIFGGLITTVSTYLFINSYGLRAAAISVILGSLVAFIVTLFFSQMSKRINYNYFIICGCLIVSTIMLAYL